MSGPGSIGWFLQCSPPLLPLASQHKLYKTDLPRHVRASLSPPRPGIALDLPSVLPLRRSRSPIANCNSCLLNYLHRSTTAPLASATKSTTADAGHPYVIILPQIVSDLINKESNNTNWIQPPPSNPAPFLLFCQRI